MRTKPNDDDLDDLDITTLDHHRKSHPKWHRGTNEIVISSNSPRYVLLAVAGVIESTQIHIEDVDVCYDADPPYAVISYTERLD